MSNAFSSDQKALLEAMIERKQSSASRFFLVGGLVRDLLLFRSLIDRDVDILVEGSAEVEARHIAARFDGTLKIFPRFLTAKVERPAKLGSLDQVDFASARTESYPFPGSLPEVRSANLDADLKRRDFTINAMAAEITPDLLGSLLDGSFLDRPVDHGLIDPFGGLTDLKQRTLRLLHPESFNDDPTRILRGIRYVSRLNGVFESGTEMLLQSAVGAEALKSVSLQRYFTEMKRMVLESDPAPCFNLLRHYSCQNGTVLSRTLIQSEFIHAVQGLPAHLSENTRMLVVTTLLEGLSQGSIPEAEWYAFGLNRRSVRTLRAYGEALTDDRELSGEEPAFAIARELLTRQEHSD